MFRSGRITIRGQINNIEIHENVKPFYFTLNNTKFCVYFRITTSNSNAYDDRISKETYNYGHIYVGVPKNTGITLYEYDADRSGWENKGWLLKTWNDHAHLG